MLRRLLGTGLSLAILAIVLSPPAHAQSSKLIQGLDKNQDGKVTREEIPEGPTRSFYDRFLEKYKLDPGKAYTVQELQEAAGLAPAGGSNSSSSSRDGGMRRLMPRLGASSGAPSRTYDGRPYRALEELPDPYRSHDKDGDGQIGLYEWPRDRIADFLALDGNNDGFITLREVKKTAPPDGEPDKDKEAESQEK